MLITETVSSLTSILDLLDLTPNTKIRGEYTKLKRCFCTAKETINKMKKQPTESEKIFANHDNMLVSKIH